MASVALKSSAADPRIKRAAAAKAARIVKDKLAEARKRTAAALRARGPAIKRDVIHGYLIPGAAATGGALAADFILDRWQPLAGARGDIAKVIAGISAGAAAHQYTKGQIGRVAQNAALGIVVVNLYKLGTRMLNRAVAGKGLSGLLNDSDNADLAGYWGNTTVLNGDNLEAVTLELEDGSYSDGYRDAAGNLYDADLALIVSNGESLSGLLYDEQTPITPRSVTASGQFVN